MHLEARIFLDAVGWAVIMAGALWLAKSNGFAYAEFAGSGYLGGVLARSFENVFQAGLFAGLTAVPLHAVWIYVVHRKDGLAKAYENFAAWGQTFFTSLGFLGTIIGVSLAVAGLEDAMSEGEPGSLVSGLSTAFDTTFLGLTASVLLMIMRNLARLSTQSAR